MQPFLPCPCHRILPDAANSTYPCYTQTINNIYSNRFVILPLVSWFTPSSMLLVVQTIFLITMCVVLKVRRQIIRSLVLAIAYVEVVTPSSGMRRDLVLLHAVQALCIINAVYEGKFAYCCHVTILHIYRSCLPTSTS